MRKEKPNSIRLILVSLVFVLFIVLNFTFLGDFFQNIFLSVMEPVKSSFWSKGISLQADNLTNDFEKTIYLTEIAKLKRELKELNYLKEVVDFDIQSDFNLVGSRVLGVSTEDDYIIISKGKKDSIFKGMPVLTSSRSLVGEIGKVLDNFSFVKLISHSEISFDAKVLDKEDSLGVINNDNQLSLEMIDRDAYLEVGDIIVTYPGSGIYPEGLFIGEISEVVKDDVNAFQTVLITPGFRTKDLSFLFIVTDF